MCYLPFFGPHNFSPKTPQLHWKLNIYMVQMCLRVFHVCASCLKVELGKRCFDSHFPWCNLWPGAKSSWFFPASCSRSSIIFYTILTMLPSDSRLGGDSWKSADQWDWKKKKFPASGEAVSINGPRVQESSW